MHQGKHQGGDQDGGILRAATLQAGKQYAAMGKLLKNRGQKRRNA